MNPSASKPGPTEIESIVREVLARLALPGGTPAPDCGQASIRSTPPTSPCSPPPCSCARPAARGDLPPGLHGDLAGALAGAQRAFTELQELSLEKRRAMIAAMREAGRQAAPELAHLAVEETGLGRTDDKILKNRLVSDKTPGVEILETWAVSGDDGLSLQELAPWGVIGAITPCTNPSETIICNAIGMVAAGNSVVFCPHPLARRTSARTLEVLNAAIAGAGGPPALLHGLAEPSIEIAQALMADPLTRLLVVTGGPGVVREAMRSGKRVIGAGPGNPPALVDETADLEQAGRDLVRGASLDNNIICTDEKVAIVVSGVADRLKSSMEQQGAHEIHGHQIERLSALLLSGTGRERTVSKEWIGRDATQLLEAIGAHPRRDVRLVLAEVDAEHPLVWTEQLTPVLPLVRVRTVEEGMDLAIAVEKGNRHTATMHSHDVTRLSRMARRIDCSIFVKNGPAYAGLGMGGEGYTSFTIAGATGEGMTTARHFCRARRCALVGAFRIV